MIKRGLLFAFSVLLLTQNSYAQSLNFWKSNDMSLFRTERSWLPEQYQTHQLDLTGLKSRLASAPEVNPATWHGETGVTIALPMPDGNFQNFILGESPIMEPGLAAQLPDIKTYAGYSLPDKSAYMRCSFTVWGFHAIIFSEEGTIYIDPFSSQTTENYLTYYKKSVPHRASAMQCLQQTVSGNDPIYSTEKNHPELNNDLTLNETALSAQRSFAGTLRTYRLAVACTGEYTAKFGGTVNGAMGGIIVSVNRVNGIYEKEVNVRLVLIANNLPLIYTDPQADPYNNNSGGAMLSQNQINVDNIVGAANYDIGHVFSTGGGGVAMLGCVCTNGLKAQGVTGSPNPMGDPFDVDYVAHEMGHQFGGNHTFNSETGSCSGNRVGSSAYENGSGSTIMAYAGICDANDIQNNSDDYFNTRSFDEIVTFITTMGGNNCPVTTPTNNQAPVLTLPAVINYTIPARTPFKLSASATDPDNDPLTYCWEQSDTGPAGNWNTPSGNAPLFRSYEGTSSPQRMFPKLATILLGNQLSLGEILPTYARNMKFRCTVRDNKAGGGGVTYNDNPVTITVVASANPFRVNTGNVSGLQWIGATMKTVTWDVVATDQPPVNTPLVNIYLSTDGGLTFPYTLAQGTPNDGSELVYIPNVGTSKARIMIEGVDNVFFDINDKDFSVFINAVSIDIQEMEKQVDVYPNPGKEIFYISFPEGSEINCSAEVVDVTGKLILRLGEISGNSTAINLQSAAPGLYFLKMHFPQGEVTKKIIKQ